MTDLKLRTFMFAVNVGKLVNDLPASKVNSVYFNQLIKCSSSVGANYRAARRAKSDADFVNKLKIVEEEADESIYFLELLKEFNLIYESQIRGLINETTEILKIIVSSITTTRAKLNQKDKL